MARRRYKSSRRRAADLFTLIANKVTSLTSNPVTLILLIVSIALGVSISANPHNNPITAFADKLIAIAALKPLGTWIKTHVINSYGFLCFLIPTFATRRYVFPVFLFAILYTAFMPTMPIYEYPVQAVFLWAMLATRNTTLKIFLLGTVVLLYFVGWGFTGMLGSPSPK